ncbi:hypothetical protein [Brevundimonas sp.]|uniref:hypothetical protein n=1 Tax=Brevundimonas sp. TaxID=1871086 RepID=UPI003F70CFEC
MQAEWQESAAGGGLLAVFMLTMGAAPFAVTVVKGMMWGCVLGGLMIALLVFIDRNGSGLRGQVLRPGRIAVIGSVLSGVAVRMLMA